MPLDDDIFLDTKFCSKLDGTDRQVYLLKNFRQSSKDRTESPRKRANKDKLTISLLLEYRWFSFFWTPSKSRRIKD
eukprot:367516-Pelagomonas_calceolata.AAC.9